jgi:hypothetical protein
LSEYLNAAEPVAIARQTMKFLIVRILVLFSLILTAQAGMVTANFFSANNVPVTYENNKTTRNTPNPSLFIVPALGTCRTADDNADIGLLGTSFP